MILSILTYLKELLVPKGSFGNGPNSKLTEIVALIIISSLLLLGFYWALIFFFIFLKTGQLTNISTTIAVYSRLEVPSMTLCSLPHVSLKDSILDAYTNDRLKVILIYRHANKNYFNFNPKIRRCYWEKQSLNNHEQCLCIDMWNQKFFSKTNAILNPPFFLFQRQTLDGFDADSISIGIKYLKPINSTNNNNSSSSNDNFIFNHNKVNNITKESSSISEILKIGIYDQPMIIANQHAESVEPSWFYSNIGNYAQVSLKLLKNYVFDVEKFYFYIIKGYVSRQENEYEIVVSQKNFNIRTPKRRPENCRMPYWIKIMNQSFYQDLNIKRCIDNSRGSRREYEVASFTKFQISFRDFSVTEVFRLSGASVIASFLTLTVVCLSAFNKQLIYELLFPYYEDINAKYTVTTIATFFSFGYLKKYTED
ncbi:uncharacterized protein cubi_03301 [Cryptosporidium ubiquitum]|uniref:Uncharacterized protein n=1 Tax=Cryptosporidium ubiquitum TaxID=857276 RepID=A0A1J4MI96_9CRYT|nr:uncharacterized protein cubi_03301 [Cryptosporidium ubiquitum]OII72565.1 hypothetical protein cubi_03301 [Cryptosporidium ubiquitum]